MLMSVGTGGKHLCCCQWSSQCLVSSSNIACMRDMPLRAGRRRFVMLDTQIHIYEIFLYRLTRDGIRVRGHTWFSICELRWSWRLTDAWDLDVVKTTTLERLSSCHRQGLHPTLPSCVRLSPMSFVVPRAKVRLHYPRVSRSDRSKLLPRDESIFSLIHVDGIWLVKKMTTFFCFRFRRCNIFVILFVSECFWWWHIYIYI
jgi:hypothetical protein